MYHLFKTDVFNLYKKRESFWVKLKRKLKKLVQINT
jgi:hypothetical protein